MSDPLIWDWFFVVLCRVFSVCILQWEAYFAVAAAVTNTAVAAVLHIDEQTKRKPFAIKAYRDHTITLWVFLVSSGWEFFFSYIRSFFFSIRYGNIVVLSVSGHCSVLCVLCDWNQNLFYSAEVNIKSAYANILE